MWVQRPGRGVARAAPDRLPPEPVVLDELHGRGLGRACDSRPGRISTACRQGSRNRPCGPMNLGMSDERPRYGPLVSGLGAAALGISVFLPWYSVTLTQSGVESAQHTLGAVARQYGNQSFQSAAG